jgi:CBS domain-containing protein
MKLKNTRLEQIIIKKPITITPDTSLVDARKIILEHKISRLIVVKKSKGVKIPIGIITEKDLAKTFYNLGNKSVKSVKTSHFMSKDIISVNKNSANSLYDCANLMKKKRISSIIITDDKKRLEGIVTKTDLVSLFLTQSVDSLKVSKVMTSKVITVSPSDSLLYAESLLINYRISRLVVVRNKIPVGIITYRDFVPARLPRWIAESADPKEVKEYRYGSKAVEAKVNQMAYLLPFNAVDIMTSNPIVVEHDKDVGVAVLLMVRNNISGLPVVKNSKIVGIVTKTDIVNVIADR